MTAPAAEDCIPTTFEEAQAVLASSLPGYSRRPQQMALAAQAERAIADGRPALFQAGTGVGKSLAALVPAILSGKRTVVATLSKALQNQYSGKDLPFLDDHLGVPFRWAVLKGRANYPCLARISEMSNPTWAQKKVIDRVNELSGPDAIRDMVVTDREDFPELTEEDWRPFSMSSAECPGKKNCPFGDACLAERAKAKAAEADVIITNTAFLMQDLILRNRTAGNVALLGEIEQLVIDEAHALQDVATGALEETMGERTFLRMSRDMAGYLSMEGGEQEEAFAIEHAATALWARLRARHAEHAAKFQGKPDPMPLRQAVIISDLRDDFLALYRAIESGRDAVKATRPMEGDKRAGLARMLLMGRTANWMTRIQAYVLDPEEKTIRWAEEETRTTRREMSKLLLLRSAPVSVGPFLREAMWDSIPTIMISATLAAGKDFSYLADGIGLRAGEAITFDAGSPFDFPRQALVYYPAKDAPEPVKKTEAAWRLYAQSVTAHLVEASGGGALLLYTSRSAMNDAHQAMATRMEMGGLTVLRQGDAPAPELVRRMKEDGNAVLFALRTFFEGIDIPGRALRLVVIDKLPFTPPTDLVFQARADLINKRERDEWASFTHLTIPGMILVLTQAFGRLIRHSDDIGVVAILDARLSTKRYGPTILNALPPARRTTEVAQAAAFLESIR